jgi:hypothetical protein
MYLRSLKFFENNNFTFIDNIISNDFKKIFLFHFFYYKNTKNFFFFFII